MDLMGNSVIIVGFKMIDFNREANEIVIKLSQTHICKMVPKYQRNTEKKIRNKKLCKKSTLFLCHGDTSGRAEFSNLTLLRVFFFF